MMQEVCNRAIKEHAEERKEIAKFLPDEAKQSLGVMLVSARDAEGFYRKIGMKNRPDSYMYHFSPKQAKDFAKHGRLTELETHSNDNDLEPNNGIFTAPTTHTLSTPAVHVKFDFPRLEDKIPAFMAWLQQQQDEGILELVTLPRMGQSLGEPWTNLFVRDSYERGVIRAREQLMTAGYGTPGLGAGDLPLMELPGMASGVLANPFHVDRLASVFLRSYDGLKGISNAMDMQISHVLAQGLADGDNPITLAKKMNYVISGMGKDLGITDSLGRFIPAERRAKMLARTEVIRSHHLATVQEYRNWGVAGVNVVAEWVTAGFNVCPICQEIARKGPYTLDQVQNMLPAHVHCRCTTIPRPMGEISVHSNPCHNPAGPGGGQFCNTGGGAGSAGSSWTVSNSVEDAKRQFKDKFGDVFKGQGVSGDVKELNVLGHETSRIMEFIPDKMRNSENFKIDHVGVYNKDEWERVRNSAGADKNASGFYKRGGESGASISLSGELSRRNDDPTIGKFSSTRAGTLQGTYRHEFGHFVHLRGLSYPQQNKWEELYNSKTQIHWSYVVSIYGASNSRELFAESFTAYTSKGYANSIKKLPAEIERFFKETLR
jgi:hypothetical protein